MRAWQVLLAILIGVLLLACSNPQPEPTPTPLIKVCVRDGDKVPCN